MRAWLTSTTRAVHALVVSGGPFGAGDTVEAELGFRSAIYVLGGTLSVQLRGGDQERELHWLRGLGSPTLVFGCTLETGETVPQAQLLSESFAANGATVNDTLSHVWGDADGVPGGLRVLADPRGLAPEGEFEAGRRLEAGMCDGHQAHPGVATSFAGFGLEDDGGHALRLGVRMNLDVEGVGTARRGATTPGSVSR